VIPVYNSRDSLLLLIERIQTVSQIPIMVIDDGSVDGLHAAELPEVTFVRHETNRGKGAALKTGFEQAKYMGFTHVLTLDADGQHDPAIILQFAEKMRKVSAALIVGVRDLLGHAMPFHRRLSNNLTSLILSLRTGIRVRDSQVGYRVYPLSDRRLWHSPEDGFQFESDIFIRAAKLKLEIIWQPVPVIYTDESSHMHLFKDTLRFVRTIFRSFMC